MKILKEAFLLTLAAMALGSCSEDNPWAGGRGKGGIDLRVSASADVQDAIPLVRSGAPELVAPDAADFAVELRNTETDQAQTWQKLEDFHNEAGFDVGTYTLTAFYGNENECGFDKPCFKGEATVNVLEGRESAVEVTAQLANVMLSVDYTDAFRDYFRNYSVTAHTEGHANVVFGSNETRAGFLTPGDVTLQVSFTNPSGQSATITPAEFPAQARHHYHVTFDVNAQPTGAATLSVIFDDSLTKENVTFELNDQLYNAEAPIVHAEGFTSGQTVEALSGNSAPGQLKFEAICKSGIKGAVLKIAQVSGSQTFAPAFPKELDLVQADESTQYQLEQSGIKVAGLFKNPEKMAIVDLTDLPRYLPQGTFEITLTVTDMVDRNNDEPVTLNLSTLPISLNVTGGSAVYVYQGNTNLPRPTVDATVLISYNGLNPESCISFKNQCRTGIWKDCEIVEVKESTATRGFTDKNYIVSIRVCDVETSPLPMQIYFNGSKYGEFNLDIIEPEYSLEADAFANYARFKVSTPNAADVATIVNGLTLYKNGTAVDKSQLTTDPEKGLLTLDGLTPDTDYTIGYSLTTRPGGIPEGQTVKIHTEAEAQIPNNFTDVVESINMAGVQVGGTYTGTAFGSPAYHYSTNIIRYLPKGWSSINAKTCWTGASPKNTWFCVPSSYCENGQVVVRSVGYNHRGTVPAKDQTTGRYYNPNSPSFTDADRIAGEFFLGSYSYDGNDHRSEGMAFESRPACMKLTYAYSPLNNEKAKVEIFVCDTNGDVIASNTTELRASSGAETLLYLNGYNKFGAKAATIKVKFLSSTAASPAITVPSGGQLNEFSLNNIGNGLKNNTLTDGTYHALATGSVLTVQKIELQY